MDGTDAEYDELKELGNLVAGLPEPREAIAAIKKAMAEGASEDALTAIIHEHLAPTIADGQWLLQQLPEHIVGPLSAEDRDSAVTFFDASVTAWLKGRAEGGTPALLGDIVEECGIRVEKVGFGGHTEKVVFAIIFPDIDIDEQLARIQRTCYQEIPQASAPRPRNRPRDSEWTRRHFEGESYRDIALSDPRSGISPEVMADPDNEEYRDEIERGRRKVAKAVQRTRKRWTQKPDPVSTD